FAAQLDRPPDADSGQTRAPVPAVPELGLAHRRPLRIAPPGAVLLLRRVIQRSIEADSQRIGLAEPEPPANVEDRRAEHVGMLAKLLAVQPDRGERIEAVEDQSQPLVGGE